MSRLLRPISFISLFALSIVALLGSPRAGAAAYGHSQVGVEFEYEAKHPSKRSEDVRNHQQLIGFARSEFGGSKIRVERWDKYSNARGTSMAGFKDEKGRKWLVVPEKMNGEAFDGFELITPPLTTDADTEKLGRVITAIKSSGEFLPGVSSSTHFTYDVSHLVGNIDSDPAFEKRNIAEFVDMVLFLETNIMSFYALVEPARYGHLVNLFSVPMALNQKELLHELAKLPRADRTFGRVRDLFKRYDQREIALSDGHRIREWKFRAFNYAKIFGLGVFDGWRLPVVEARIADLIEDPVKLDFVGRLFARAISFGAKFPASVFRDPFPGIESFVNNSVEHAALDKLVRSESSGRIDAFLKKLGMAKPTGRGLCESLFSSMEQ